MSFMLEQAWIRLCNHHTNHLRPCGVEQCNHAACSLKLDKYSMYSSATVCFVSAVKKQGGLTRGFPSVVKSTVEPLYRPLEIASALF